MQRNQNDRARLKQLVPLGLEITTKASDVPLGSLSQAIGAYCDCTITLWPMQQLSSLPDGARAVLYQRFVDGHRDCIVLYARPKRRPGALDRTTRQAIGHELAHILLGHRLEHRVDDPLVNGNPEGKHKEEQLEANFLASLFLRTHGGPRKRDRTPSDEMDWVLAENGVSDRQRQLIMDVLDQLVPRHQDETTSDRNESEQIAKDVLLDYETHENFRDKLSDEVVGLLNNVLSHAG